MMIRSLLIVLLVMIAAAGASAAEPRLLVFAAGIENYDHPELDKLQFAADDARDIFKLLQVVAALDERSELHVADDADGSKLEEGDLRNAIREFARKIRNNDTVVVYLGGHGTLSPGGELLILPSDYEPESKLRFLEFENVRRILEQQISRGGENGTGLAGVKVAFIVNVCGAGNATEPGDVAMAVPTDDSIIAEVARVAKDLSIGEAEVAVIPATPRGRNTFERAEYGRSVFAKYLVEALDGAAAGADDVLTTGEIIGHIEVALGEDLPRNAGFASDIILGETKRTRGRDHLTMGTALMGAARAMPDPDIARLLNDLALFHFEEVQGRNPDLAPRAAFRSLQLRVLNQEIVGSNLAAEAEALPYFNFTVSEQALLEEFAGSKGGVLYPSFAEYLNALESDPEARILVLEPGLSKAEPNLIDDVLALRFGRERVWSTKMIVEEPVLGSTFLSDAAAYLSQPVTATPPLVVYSGNESRPSCYVVNEECVFVHDWAVILEVLRESNDAPFVFLYDAPAGGALERIAPTDLMLLLTASQTNGVTIGGAVPRGDADWIISRGTSPILFNGILNRRDDSEVFARIRYFHRPVP